MKNKRIKAIITISTLLLFIPLIAMRYTKEVNWGIFDFLIMSILLLTVGFSCELVLRKVKTLKNRIILFSIVLLLFLLIWAELAIGVFETFLAGN